MYILLRAVLPLLIPVLSTGLDCTTVRSDFHTSGGIGPTYNNLFLVVYFLFVYIMTLYSIFYLLLA